MKSIQKMFLLGLLFISFHSKATVSYESIKTSGIGCPAGSAGISTVLDPDRSSASIIFDNFRLEKTPYQKGNPITSSVDCNVETTYHANYDEQFVILTGDWRGYYQLAPQTTGSFKAESQIVYKDSTGKIISSALSTSNQTFTGPTEFGENITMTSNIADINTVTDCGQSFSLKTKMKLSLSSNNTTEMSSLGIDSLDLSQNINSSVVKVACLNPWKAEKVSSLNSETIQVKVTTENPKVNQLASLYVVAEYQGQYYSYTPQDLTQPWKPVDLNAESLPAYGTGNAPKEFYFNISGLKPIFHGAAIYVGVGYGIDETSRSTDLKSTKRYKKVFSIP